jgi:hypothetical protein
MPSSVHPDELRSSYDAVAEAYADKFFDELAQKPFDRRLLDAFADALPSPIALDVGCGPGHVGRRLSERGLEVTGVDLSPRMIELARQLNPNVHFEVRTCAACRQATALLVGLRPSIH